MNEDAPDKPVAAEQPAVERQDSNPLLETAQGFVADESEGYREAIESRASEEAARPGLMKRMVTSAKARMAMTIVAGASALTLGGAPQSEAGGIKKILKDAVHDIGTSLEHGGRILGQEEEIRAERARRLAYEAQTAMQDATYKLRQIEGELPRISRQVKVAQFEVLKLAATDPAAKEVRSIMNARTAVKIDLWKASYSNDKQRIEELSSKDAELEEALLPHLGSQVAQKAGDIFVNTIMPGELQMLDLEAQERYLSEAMKSAGREMHNAIQRYQGHAERARRAYELAILGGRGGYGRY